MKRPGRAMRGVAVTALWGALLLAPASGCGGGGDLDGDGLADRSDNCPSLANPDQTDANADGFGDACVPVNTLI